MPSKAVRKKNQAGEKSRTILVVEDDLVVANLLRHTLSKRGFRIDLVKNGQEAIENIENFPPPDLVLLDILLPYYDGFELLKRMRGAKNNWRKVPIIMLTSKTQEVNVVRAFDYGADDYVTKPFQIEELSSRIRRLMR